MRKVDCFKCRHFKTTWNPSFPRACEAYGFKGKEIPSSFVLKASGEPCKQYSPKQVEIDNTTIIKRSNVDFKA